MNDTASNEQGTKGLLRWFSSWGWLAGRATGHRPTLRKATLRMEFKTFGEKQKTAEGFIFFLRYISIAPKPLDVFFFLHCDDKVEFWVWALESGDCLSYNVDQVLGSDWLQELTPVRPKKSSSMF